MEELTIKNHKGINVIDSREVAEMIGIRHSDLLEKIQGSKKVKGYIEILENGKFRSQDFLLKTLIKQMGIRKLMIVTY